MNYHLPESARRLSALYISGVDLSCRNSKNCGKAHEDSHPKHIFFGRVRKAVLEDYVAKLIC